MLSLVKSTRLCLCFLQQGLTDKDTSYAILGAAIQRQERACGMRSLGAVEGILIEQFTLFYFPRAVVLGWGGEFSCVLWD